MTKDEGLVSVVVPVYNAEKWIEDTILTVKSQTYRNWELILVNDGSKDASLKIMEQYSSDRIIIIDEGGNHKAAYTRNRGVREAKGRFICFIDADDLWSPDKLEKQIDFMLKKDAAFSFTGYEFADADGIGVRKMVHVPDTINYRQALKNTTIFTSTVMFDMTKLTKEDIKMPEVPSEDTATWWKLLRSGVTGYGLDEMLTLYRRGTGTLSSNKFTAIKRIWNLYRNVEKLSLPVTMICFICWAFRAVLRRI